MGWIRRDDVEESSFLHTNSKFTSDQFPLSQYGYYRDCHDPGYSVRLFPLQGYFDGNYAFGLAFDTIFFSLSFLGLMRIPAAFWLTKDFSYADINRIQRRAGEEMEDLELEAVTTKSPARARTLSDIGLLAADSELLISPEEIFYPSNCWRSMAIRVIFLTPLVGSLALSTAYIGQSQPEYGNFFTGTHLVLILFYLAVTVGVVVIFLIYFWKGNTGDTVLPCIGQT
jgi:hypothetical protein